MTSRIYMPTISKSRLVAVLSAIVFAFFFILPASTAHAAGASLTVTPDTIFLGGTVTVSWSSSDTFKCVGSGFNTGDKTSGSATVKPSSTGVKTYAMSCYVTSPSCSLQKTGSFTEDAPGQNTCQNITAPNGGCYPNGAQCMTSTKKTASTWTLTQYQCTGGCTTVSASDTVTVNSAPPPTAPSATITASPTTVTKGDSSLVSWSSSGATTCRGTNFSTGGATKGSVSVTPTKNTTYSITCDGQVFSSTPGTWQYVGPDITDLWCTQTPGNYSNFYTDNQCPGNSDPSGQSCTGSDTCAVNNWQTKGGTFADKPQYCNLKSDVYQCNGGSGTPNQVTDSVTVVVNHAPNAPVITGPTFGAPDTNYSFSFRADDPDGDKIRYRIDWDNNGSADQILPASGHVNSNTLLDAFRSWTGSPAEGDETGDLRREEQRLGGVPESYTFRAKTQDIHGALSGWASHTIVIGNGEDEPPVDEPECSDGIDNDGDDLIDADDFGCGGGGGGGGPGYNPNDNSESPNPQCSDGIDNNGNGLIDYPNDPACSSLLDNNEEALPPAALSLSAPSLIQPDTAVSLSWSATNAQAGSCSLSGTNGDSWTLSGTSGTKTSSALASETIFTLSCIDLNGDPVSTAVTVTLVPSFEEI